MSSTMSMSSTATSAAAVATSTTMDMAMDMDSTCEISMLWNWSTIDACFISSSWHITSNGMFAGSCIGVILLVISLEFLRRLGKEYDRFLVRTYATPVQVFSDDGEHGSENVKECNKPPSGFKPTILQQSVRALLHMLQFAVAYFIMLLAMYFNGYIIICIFIGAYIGSFIFSWETLGGGTRALGQTSATEEATVCCG